MFRNKIALLGLGLVLLSATACGGPRGRIMSDEEDDLVGDRRAGSATYDRLVQGSVEGMLQWYTSEVLEGQAATGMRVAFAGIENATAEELGEWRDELSTLINTSINNYEGFSSISPRYVSAALRATSLQVDDLFLPAKRREFMAALERQDNPAEALVFAKLTRGVQSSTDVTQARYRLTLDMVDSETGVQKSFDAAIRKEYSR